MAILFMEDWAKYPGARPDYSTKNKSFITLASYYKSMGVKNHSFLLALIDQRLKGVDPHNPDLDLVTLGRIAVEQSRNPWYWFREIARVPSIGGGDARMLEANRGIIAALWCYFNHITLYLIQPRQTGKSLFMELLIIYLSEAGCKKTKIGLLTRSEKLRTSTLEKIKEADKCLPKALNFQRKDDARNTFMYTVKALKNRFTAYLPSKSEKTADALGRGFTLGNFFGDEIPFCDNAHITVPALLPATIAARNEIKKQGGYYGLAFLTTAGNRKTPEGEYMYNRQSSAALWTELLFDAKNAGELEKIVRANSRGTTLRGDGLFEVTITMDHRQLGKTDEWLIDAAEITGSTGDQLRMDYFNEWVAGSASHPLSRALQSKIESVKKPILYSDLCKTTGYIIRWYIPKSEIKKRMKSDTIIAVDSSDAGGGDDIALVIMDIKTGEVLGAGNFNYTSVNLWSKWLYGLLMRFKKSTLVVEKKSSGGTIMDTVVDLLIESGENPFKRVFNMIVNNYKSDPKLFLEMQGAISSGNSTAFYYKYKKHFGFNTSGYGVTSRKALYGNLKEAATLIGHLINDEELKNQILGLVKDKAGRVDHQPGSHDDMVISWLLNYWVITQANNLNYYGIDPLEVLRYVPVETRKVKNEDPEQVAKEQYQKDLKAHIGKLKAQYAVAKDAALKYAIKSKIMSLASHIESNNEDMNYQPAQVLQSLKESNITKKDRKRPMRISPFTY